MLQSIQIPCITKHYFPATVQSYMKVANAIYPDAKQLDNFTCCGLPFFEKGELGAAKKTGEHNLKIINGNYLSCSEKCFHTFTYHNPKLFNNTLVHNEVINFAKRGEFIYEKLSPAIIENCKKAKGTFFFIGNCETKNEKLILNAFKNIEWKMPQPSPNCCGAGACLPTLNFEISEKMALSIIEQFQQSGAEALVFSEDLCRQHILNIARKNGLELETKNIIDMIAETLS